MASKRVMQQSISIDPTVVMPEQNVVPSATGPQGSQLMDYALPGAALLVALIALAVAMLR